MSLEAREPLRWLHVRRQRHLVSEPRACVRADEKLPYFCDAISLLNSIRQPSIPGEALDWGRASYVCVCGNDWKSASKYVGVGRSAQIQTDRVDP